MVNVILTRSTDTYLMLSERANIANRAGVDLFLSFHENSATNQSATGYEDYISGNAASTTIAARRVFHNVVAQFLNERGIRNRGMKTASYQVLRQTTMPAILAEHLFISNPVDLQLQTNPQFIEQSAQMYARAIRETLTSLGKANGTVCLDAGHGGHDAGAVNGQEHEKNHVLRLVLRIKQVLEGGNAAGKIEYRIMDGAQAFRIQSGRFETQEAMETAMNNLLREGYLLYAEPQQLNSSENGWRFISGRYTLLPAAVDAATKIINTGKLGYVTIIGTID